MDLKKNQNSMYPGTWICRKNKKSCTQWCERGQPQCWWIRGYAAWSCDREYLGTSI